MFIYVHAVNLCVRLRARVCIKYSTPIKLMVMVVSNLITTTVVIRGYEVCDGLLALCNFVPDSLCQPLDVSQVPNNTTKENDAVRGLAENYQGVNSEVYKSNTSFC